MLEFGGVHLTLRLIFSLVSPTIHPGETENTDCGWGVCFSLHASCCFRLILSPLSFTLCFFCNTTKVLLCLWLSQITAKRLSLPVLHKQKAALYPSGLRKRAPP